MKTEKFEVLNDVEHVRRRPQMYIGATSLETTEGFVNGVYKKYQIVPGLVKIIDEVLDNCVDEFIRTNGRYADKIEVSMADDSIWIEDNGRGIPVEKHNGQWRPFLCWGAARAGTSFGSDRDTIGAHGLGSFLTNVFSTKFQGISNDGKKTYNGKFENGQLVKEKLDPGVPATGTQVGFTPAWSLFGYAGCPPLLAELIKDRLYHLSATYPGIKFKFNTETIKYKNRKEFCELYLKQEEAVIYEDTNNLVIIGPAGKEEEFRFSSHVNGLNLRQGGTQVDVVMMELINELRPLLKKKYKLDVLPNQIKQHLMFVQIVRKMTNLQFDSQTKNKITNPYPEVKTKLNGIDYAWIAKKVVENELIVVPIVEALLFKKQLEEQRALNKEQNNTKKLRVANHVSASSKDPDDRILFIAEGDSAIGQLRNVRNPKIHGGYALRGKVMNTREMRPLEVVQNKELSELMSILNIKFGEKANRPDYSKICILTDADVDGQSIMCLLINFFSNWPELFETGRVFRVETPIVIARKGKEEKRFYSTAEFAKEDLSGWNVEYYKGLGSLSEEEYSKAINHPRLMRINLKDRAQLDSLEMAFGANSDVRKTWLMK